MSTIELKVKNKTLAAEAQIIRKEENKLRRQIDYLRVRDPHCKTKMVISSPPGADYNRTYYRISHGWTPEAKALLDQLNGLSEHRRKDVRMERRASHLAYCFLRGTPYKKIEQSTHSRPKWAAVERMVKRFSGEDERVVLQRFAEWTSEEGRNESTG